MLKQSILTSALLLTASLSAFAQVSKIHIDTSVEDFNYETLTGTLKIQSFVENDIIDPSVVIKPMDIILVLDVSSSMNTNKVTYYPYTKQESKGYSYTGYGTNTLYYRYEGKYYQVSRGNYNGQYYLRFDIGNGQYRYLTGTGVSTTQPTDITTTSATIWTGVLYKRGTQVTETRLAVMKKAAANFFDLIKEKSQDIDNRMAIVKFSSSATTLSNLVSVKNNATTLRNYLTDLSWASGTGTLNGITNATTIINNLSTTDLNDRDQVMIVFSDGDPDGTGTEANNVVKACKTLKVDKGVTIYSIGLLNSKAADYTKKMMEYLSSNYPNATSTSSAGTRAEGDYYWNDPTGESLNELFESIAEKLEPAKILIGVETKMQGGTLQSSISLNLPSATSTIDAKTASLTGYSNGTFTFSTTEENVTGINIDKTTLTATGFDYSANWCGLDDSDQPHGKALILRIPFTFTPTSVNQELELYESGKTPGLYNKDSDEYVLAAAPPTPEFVELIIEKKGLHAGESAIFDLDRVKLGSETNDVHVNRIVLTGTSSSGTAASYTVPFLNPAATYIVTERTDWSWTYKPTETPESNGFIKKSKDMTTVTSGTTAKLTFENTKYSADKLAKNAEAIRD